ncbi:unnamed protein product [Prorocentrum cordatum]|uniref:FHA domain-containing protein n=1 Tax=Prorocentrum cordatum TaxID=2364126 RepID=A0ABN9SK63_9DINO|nr:unnamed protein product [Polarella glacialis]
MLPSESTATLRPGAPTGQPRPHASPQASWVPPAVLLVQPGPGCQAAQIAQRYVLRRDGPTRIGRGESCDLQLVGPHVSGVHCCIVPRPDAGGWEVQDASSNGTYVIKDASNSIGAAGEAMHTLGKLQSMSLSDRDEIRLTRRGSWRMQFRVEHSGGDEGCLAQAEASAVPQRPDALPPGAAPGLVPAGRALEEPTATAGGVAGEWLPAAESVGPVGTHAATEEAASEAERSGLLARRQALAAELAREGAALSRGLAQQKALEEQAGALRRERGRLTEELCALEEAIASCQGRADAFRASEEEVRKAAEAAGQELEAARRTEGRLSEELRFARQEAEAARAAEASVVQRTAQGREAVRALASLLGWTDVLRQHGHVMGHLAETLGQCRGPAGGAEARVALAERSPSSPCGRVSFSGDSAVPAQAWAAPAEPSPSSPVGRMSLSGDSPCEDVPSPDAPALLLPPARAPPVWRRPRASRGAGGSQSPRPPLAERRGDENVAPGSQGGRDAGSVRHEPGRWQAPRHPGPWRTCRPLHADVAAWPPSPRPLPLAPLGLAPAAFRCTC